MHRILSVLFLFLLLSCKDALRRDSLPHSFGEHNSILVVIDDKLWYGNIGDSIRSYLASFVKDVEPAESEYSLLQISPRLFDQDYKKYRNIVVFSDNHNDINFSYEGNKFASPQNYFVVTAMNRDELVNTFILKNDSIKDLIKKTEIQVYIDNIRSERLHPKELLSHPFDIELDLPLTFKQAKKGEDFIWFKKDIASGSSNILVYAVPIHNIENANNTVIDNIIATKDSVTRKYIQSSEVGSMMKTYIKEISSHKSIVLGGKEGIVIEGTWDMLNSFMTGPYMTYVFKDEEIDHYVFIEGMVYNPSMSKRKMLAELEGIINTIYFK